MISLKCRNCGGEMSVDLKGGLYCAFCGAASYFSDEEMKEYRDFRMQILKYLRAQADWKADEEDSSMWNYHESAEFSSADGTPVVIDYLFCSEDDSVKTYTARNSVVQVFGPEDSGKADQVRSALQMPEFPSADLKNIGRYFPTIISDIPLSDGGRLLAYSKPGNVYPLFAYGSIKPEHAAWIVSRMENFCCVFEYSGMVHGGISFNSVFVNTRTHEAYLYGGWWNARRKTSSGISPDLYAVRRTAGSIMGEYRVAAPAQFTEFLRETPRADAFEDFERWDEVIEKGFGGHHFVKFTAD